MADSQSIGQWKWVATIVGALILGAVALVKFAPVPEGVVVGKRAPDFRALDLATGDTVSFREEYAGHVTLVNIWATWCPPCREEMPAMQRLYEALKDKGFRIAAVSIDEGSANDVTAFTNRFGLSFDILHDKSGRMETTYQVTGFPESFLVNRSGVIVKKVLSSHPWDSRTNQAVIEALLADSTGAGPGGKPAEH